jgi:tetratricopeptide (TPR) repeat protein
VSAAAVIFSMLAVPEVFAQGRSIGRIQGQVLVDGTQEPVAGAVVRAVLPAALQGGDPFEPVETTTDDNGRFAINWIRSGMWQVVVSGEGYDSSVRRIEVTQSRSYACRGDEMRCREPVEFSMVKLFNPLHPTEAPSEGLLAGILADDLQAELDAAYDLFDRGDYDSAIASYEAVLERVPLLTSLHLQIGHAYRAKEDYERALLAYRAVPAQTAAWTEAESAIQELQAVGSVR